MTQTHPRLRKATGVIVSTLLLAGFLQLAMMAWDKQAAAQSTAQACWLETNPTQDNGLEEICGNVSRIVPAVFVGFVPTDVQR